MEQIYIKKNSDRRIKHGHQWFFSNELLALPKLDSGTLVEVICKTESGDRQFINNYGLAFYNPQSLISLRLLNCAETFNREVIRERIVIADNYRKRFFGTETMYRLTYGESDNLPGLVIDRYGDYFSIQTLSAGIEHFLNEIVGVLYELFPETKGIIEKNTSKQREYEGLELREGILAGSIPEEIYQTENDIKLAISLESGQKTGYFLDQRLNRLFVQSISKELKVLDCFCNQGGFALNAAKGGAEEITGIDISAEAISRAGHNAALNNFTNCKFITADVADFMRTEIENKQSWDMIVLDPPAYTKSKKTIYTALAGYAKINRLALQLLSPGGFLVSSSCSQLISEEMFADAISKEAAKAGRRLTLAFRGQQSPDHPILTGMPETQYLKFQCYRVD